MIANSGVRGLRGGLAWLATLAHFPLFINARESVPSSEVEAEDRPCGYGKACFFDSLKIYGQLFNLD